MNMTSSPVRSAYPKVSGSPGHFETMLGSPSTSQSQSSTERPALRQSQPEAAGVKRPCNYHCNITIDPNQPCFEIPSPNDAAAIHSNSSLPEGFPPVMQHLSLYTSRAVPKFQPRLPGGDTPTALEHRFMTKNILKRNEADISLIDVHQVRLLQGQYYKSDHTYEHNNRAKISSNKA